MKKKIFVIGSYGAGNIGDEAILKSIKDNLNDFEIIAAVPHLPFRLIMLPFRLGVIWRLWRSDVVIIGGGGLFTDSDTIKAIKIWSNALSWAKFFRKRVYIYANSIGPFRSDYARDMATASLEKADRITVRDKISLNQLESLGLKGKLFADPVFLFKIPDDKPVVSKIIAVSLRHLNIHSELNGSEKSGLGPKAPANIFDHEAFDAYLKHKEKEGYQVLFVSMDPNDSGVFDSYYEHEDRHILVPKDFSELLLILNKCEICIGMRLHFLIASSLLNKKMLAISYSSKVKGVMDEIGIKCVGLHDKSFMGIDKLLLKPKDIQKQKDLVKELNNDFKDFGYLLCVIT